MKKKGSESVKAEFLAKLKTLVASLGDKISTDGDWNIRGFIDIEKTIYTNIG